jgi:two-component system, chemotaxis family, response regulator WspF
VRIAVVSERPDAVHALQSAVDLDPAHGVAWTAASGAEAVERCCHDRPDLVLLDLLGAGLDTSETARRIMERTPCAILLVTDSVRANTARVFDAMVWGAVDAVDFPRLNTGTPAGAAPLLAKIAMIAKLIGAASTESSGVVKRGTPAPTPSAPLIAIGASAGGPSTLIRVLHGLPASLRAAIVIVQHVDAQFAPAMAEWLGRHSPWPVSLAAEGDQPAAGQVLLAGTGDHLRFRSAERLEYSRAPIDCAYRPSIDVFFDSVSRFWRQPAIGVLLTGMGRDGAAGLRAMRVAGHHTIAQDEKTSAVYGMPKAAAALDAAVEVLSIDRIGPRLADLITARSVAVVR